MPNKTIKFKQFDNGLYATNPEEEGSIVYHNEKMQFVNTVEENLKFLTPRQFERAKKARKLFEAMDTPTIQDLKAMIRMNLIRNNEVTTEDVNLAKKAFGPDVGAIKGKTTRRNQLQ